MKKLLSVLLATALLLTMIPLSAVSAATLVWPVPGHTKLSQGYHNNNAIDISDGSIANATVVAAMGGTVSGIYLCGSQHYGSMGDCNGFGTGLVIRGDDGRTYQYAHMAPNSIPANVYYGARVASGQTIGKVGTTGNSSGYHLHFAISNTANYWEAGPNPASETYTDQVVSLKVVESVNCKFKVVIPANYKLNLYYNETDSNPTTERWINPQTSSYTLVCDKKVMLSDGSVRYHFVSGDGYSVLFQYDSSCMTVSQNHSWNNATCTKAKTCSLCGATSGSALGHNYADATCTKAKTCKTCGATSGSALGHNYTDATCTAAKTCKTCGATSGSALGHKYDNDCDKFCNTCGVGRSISHNYADATCTKPKTCKTCGYTEGDKLDHIWKDGVCAICSKASPTAVAITTQPKDTAVKVNKAATVSLKATGDDLTYAWYVCDVQEPDKYYLSPSKTTDTYSITLTPDRVGRKAYCIVTDKYGNSVKSDTVTLSAVKIPASELKASLSKTAYTYNGKVQKPSVTVKDSKGNVLKKGADYTVSYASGCVNVGTYKVTVKMMGNYTGTKTLTFKIKPIDVSKCKISLSTTTYTYNGSVRKPAVTVKNHKGTKLNTTHYTVTYASGRKNVGTYKVTVKMKGNYTGTKTLTFKINPAKTSVSSLTAGTKKLTVKWSKKSAQVTGYQIQYSTSKSFKSYTTKTLSGYKKTSLTLTGLSAKKTYYVRVRTYKVVNGKKVYSAWSTVKYKKTK